MVEIQGWVSKRWWGSRGWVRVVGLRGWVFSSGRDPWGGWGLGVRIQERVKGV